MGVASNMCVQYRSMGIRNMKQLRAADLVVADLVEAITSNGLDAAGQTRTLNFTPAGGTARVQAHLEQHLAPTFESRQLLAAAGMQPHAGDKRPHIVLIAAEAEYDSQQTLAAHSPRRTSAENFRCTLLAATGPEGSGRDDIPGLAALYDADLLVLSMRRRSLPVVQMDHLERYHPRRQAAGRAAHQRRRVPDAAGSAARLRGLGPLRPGGAGLQLPGLQSQVARRRAATCGSRRRRPAIRSCRAWTRSSTAPRGSTGSARWPTPRACCCAGRWSTEDPDEPVAWTNTYAGGRVFYTTLGHPGDFDNRAFQPSAASMRIHVGSDQHVATSQTRSDHHEPTSTRSIRAASSWPRWPAAHGPYVIPSGVLACAGRPGANDRLTLGHIGVGGMGGTHLGMSLAFRKAGTVNIAAVCEVDASGWPRRPSKVGDGCRTYRDYRELLAAQGHRRGVIASPDHWHAVQTVHACQAGKHVYVEKPASCTVADGQAMVEAAREAQARGAGRLAGPLGRAGPPGLHVPPQRHARQGAARSPAGTRPTRPAARRRKRRRRRNWTGTCGSARCAGGRTCPAPIIRAASAGSWSRAAA